MEEDVKWRKNWLLSAVIGILLGESLGHQERDHYLTKPTEPAPIYYDQPQKEYTAIVASGSGIEVSSEYHNLFQSEIRNLDSEEEF